MFLFSQKNLTFRHQIYKPNEESITFDQVIDEVQNKFVDCKVNRDNKYELDDTFRKCKQDWGYDYCVNFDKLMVQQVHAQYPNWVIHPIRFFLLKYENGGFFKPHIDHSQGLRTSNDKTFRHVATILVIPPLELHPHDGGELILYLDDKNQTIKADENWNIVIFKLGIVHEVLELLNGIRYVFKGQVYEKI